MYDSMRFCKSECFSAVNSHCFFVDGDGVLPTRIWRSCTITNLNDSSPGIHNPRTAGSSPTAYTYLTMTVPTSLLPHLPCSSVRAMAAQYSPPLRDPEWFVAGSSVEGRCSSETSKCRV